MKRMRRDDIRKQIDDDYALFFTGGYGGALVDAFEKEKELRQLQQPAGPEEDGNEEEEKRNKE